MENKCDENNTSKMNKHTCPDAEDSERSYKTLEDAKKEAQQIKGRFENQELFNRCIKSVITRDGGVLWHRGVGLAQEWINLQFYIELATKLKVV